MAPPTRAGHRRGHVRFRRLLLIVLTLTAFALVGCGDDDESTAPSDGGATSTTADPAPADGAPTSSPAEDGAGAGWSVFESSEGGFRVELPGEPARGEQQVDAQGTLLQLVAFSTASGSTLYNVAYVDYPEIVSAIDPIRTLDGVVQGAANQARGTVIARQSLTASGSPAVDYTIELSDGRIQARAILAGTRLYLLQQASEAPDQPGFERMVGSFELIPA